VNGKEKTQMKNEVEDIPMTFVWYAVAVLVVIGIVGVIVVVIAANYLQSSLMVHPS
jgi:hypothetical protein